MSDTNKSLAKDLFPRALGIALIALTAWIMTSFLDRSDHDKWLKTLDRANSKAVKSLGNSIELRLQKAQSLSLDGRLRSLFSDEFEAGDRPSKLARRSLYEFKYINEIDHAYIYNSVYGEIVLSTAGSPDLPSRSLNNFYNAAKGKLDRLTNIVLIGGQSYILVSQAIRNSTGIIVGYAIYTDSNRNFFSEVSKPLRTHKDITFSTYMIEDDTAIAVEDFTLIASSMRVINQGKEVLPIFAKYFKVQEFTDEKDERIFAVGTFLSSIPKWKVTSQVKMSIVFANSENERNMLVYAFIFGIITLLLLPFQGPYTETLKSMFQKVGLNITDGANTPSIDADSINRMGANSMPSLGSSVDANQKDLVKKRNMEQRSKVKEDYKPSDAVIAYNIRTGMKNKRLKLLYQPIFDAKSNEPYMYEVFLRIIDDEGKIMPPSIWLPVAAKENLFSLIDETVVGVAVEKFFVRPNPLTIPLAFNISGNTFGSLEFLEQLMSSSSSSYPIAENTIFELRSREIIEDKRAMSFIKECRDMGFRFSIDYFGGGPQTLKAAKTLKFDYVKLDILQFDLDDEKGQKEFVRLIKTAESIGLPVVAEKIEDERTLRFCKRVGVNFVQGYHLAEPATELLK